jgi:hypothetical protein
MKGEESGDVRKSETPQGGVGTQMPRSGSIPDALHQVPYPGHCIHPEKCVGRTSCPRGWNGFPGQSCVE